MTLYDLFIILILIIASLLILIIMVQNPKGGGLDSSFGGGAQIGGVQDTNKFLDKATWTLAISLFVLIIFSNFVYHSSDAKVESTIKVENFETPKTEAPTTSDTPVNKENTTEKE
ncbi:MAG TPA: preprotein translocase subunit SecG [Flavobacteriia bacterium]|jgi:preprotein translocase subunit SecG|nr:preprotein translocase subunit SecG [Flavobacteriia bacterium]